MSKIQYDEYLEDDPMFSPCIHCGCPDFVMDWEEGIYKCVDCNEPIYSQSNNFGKKRKQKEGVKKFKNQTD